MMPKSTNDFNVNKVWIWLDVYSWLRALIDDDKQTNKTEGIIHYTAHANANTLALVNKSEEFFFFFFFRKTSREPDDSGSTTWREWMSKFEELREEKWEGVFIQTHGFTHAEHLKEQDALSSVFGLMKTNNLDIYYSAGALPCIF